MLVFFSKPLNENASSKISEEELKDKLENIKEIIEDKSRFYRRDLFSVKPYLKILD